MAGDVDGYRRVCAGMLERFAKDAADHPEIAERTAKACSLAPGAVADFARVEALATQAVTGTEKNGYYRYFVLAKGLADYRAGRHAEAVKWLEQYGPNPAGTHWDATAFCALAMAYHHLDHAPDAQAALGKAKAIVAAKRPDPAKGRPYGAGDWNDWIHCQILLREAEEVVGGRGGARDDGG
jgi:hypothetical protein